MSGFESVGSQAFVPAQQHTQLSLGEHQAALSMSYKQTHQGKPINPDELKQLMQNATFCQIKTIE